MRIWGAAIVMGLSVPWSCGKRRGQNLPQLPENKRKAA